ncbi:MAG: hypothetical protein HFACDABA_00731 [Anaerolineales bacterium]|nr:hypothetical protein [Anaerolineales bacterium]
MTCESVRIRQAETGVLADYSETYQYDTSTGNLVNKNELVLNYPAANGARPHAVTSAGSNTYGYDANGNQTTRTIAGQTVALGYDAENRLVSATGNNLAAQFTYDGDGRRVKSIVNGETILFAGPFGHYELKGNEVTKYYFAGASRIAVRKYIVPQLSTLTYLAGDHLGSTSLAMDASTGDVIETRYKPWGEVRYTTPSKTLPTRYTFTGQYSYVSDDATDLGAAGFGLMFYNARWYDHTTGRFAQADTIVPGGVQGLDRYAYVSNNPIIYTDPSGHSQQRNGYRSQIHANKVYEAWGETLPDCVSNNGQNHYCKLPNGIIIDVTHFNVENAFDFWKKVVACFDKGQSKCTVKMPTQSAQGFEFSATYTIDLTNVTSKEQLARIAGGVWWDYQVKFEEWERSLGGGYYSTFRAEDIPSEYLAFIAAVMAYELMENGNLDKRLAFYAVYNEIFAGGTPTKSGVQAVGFGDWLTYLGSEADQTCARTGYCDYRTPRTSSIAFKVMITDGVWGSVYYSGNYPFIYPLVGDQYFVYKGCTSTDTYSNYC